MFEYSKKELALLSHYDSAIGDISHFFVPSYLYNMVARIAFIQPVLLDYTRVVYDDSLRKCLRAFDDNSIYRMTPEWDALIDDRVLDEQS